MQGDDSKEGKDSKRLSRAELLEMLIEQSKEVESLKKKVDELQKQLDDRTIQLQQTGSIAEAALALNDIFKAADQAASQYIESIKRMEHEKNVEFQTLRQFLYRNLQVNGLSGLVHKLYVIEKTRSTTSGRYQDIFKSSDLAEHPPLDIPECFFPSLGKKLADGLMVTAFYIVIQIDKRESQLLGQHLSHSGFSGSHISNQKYTLHIYMIVSCKCILLSAKTAISLARRNVNKYYPQ